MPPSGAPVEIGSLTHAARVNVRTKEVLWRSASGGSPAILAGAFNRMIFIGDLGWSRLLDSIDQSDAAIIELLYRLEIELATKLRRGK